MGRGGSDTINPQSLLYGRKPFREREPDHPAPPSYLEEIERLRAAQSPIFSARLEDDHVAEAWFSQAAGEDPSSVLRIKEMNERGRELFSVETVLPQICQEIQHLERGGSGLRVRWRDEDGTTHVTSAFEGGVSVSEPAEMQGEHFHLDDGVICAARKIGDRLQVERDGSPAHGMRIESYSILVQGKGLDSGQVMVEGAGEWFWIVDMASGEKLTVIPYMGEVKEASFISNGFEFVACSLDQEGMFTVWSDKRGELMSTPLVDGEALFRGSLSPLTHDRDGNVCLAWSEEGVSGRTEIYGSRFGPEATGFLHGTLIDICEPGVQVEAITTVPGSGRAVWSEYGGKQPALRTDAIKRPLGRASIGERQPGERVWIDSVREGAFGGGEVLWRMTEKDSDESKLFRNEI